MARPTDDASMVVPPPVTEGSGLIPPARNFALQDYLSLSGHPVLHAAGPAPHSALADGIAAFLHLTEVETYVSGTEAMRAAMTRTIRPNDDVIIDSGAHSAMFETVLAAGATPHRCPSGSVEAVERRLKRLSGLRGRGRLFVALSAVSAHGSVVADLPLLLDLARLHGASLVLDVSHDLGSMGLGGAGLMEIQGCLGRIDVVVGSFAKCFGAKGGFAGFATSGHHTRTARRPLPAANAAIIRAALSIVQSEQGRTLRRRLHSNTLRLRNHLMADGLPVMGQPSPLVPLRLPKPTAAARTALLHSAGARVTLLQSPIVAAHAPRWRIGLTANHSAADIDDLAELIREVSGVFDRQRRSHAASPIPTHA
ncbi:aminotransferase class I/II-fold pyridoxal phosphate-dependent enzyme [Tabrizicola sp.]|uniref:aminotransferase class I/II-fold pyridoxal phosphate-dependent enzyme n=1 Tax=Tabrizicola sp. TaxID=2005166 RepID=UPI00286B1358|nr:aminotransferase class I/II-fold pyridoxal phosphate-dependent enzyme [Tabrizicola sp.]